GVAQARQRQRDAVDERLELRLGADRAPSALVERRLVGEERRDVPVGAEPEQHEIELLERAELLLVRLRAAVLAELPAHPVRRSAASRAAASASTATTISTSSATFGEFPGTRHRGLDRVQERGAHTRLLELADRGDRGAAGRGDGLAQLDRVHLLVAELLRGA